MFEKKKKYVSLRKGKRYIHMSESMSIYQSIARLMFPKGLLNYFTVVDVIEKDIPISEQQGVETGEIIFYLDEIDQLQHPEEGHTYRPNGFYEASKVRDFPLRDKKVTLVVRRRRWIDETIGKSIGNTYDLVAEGTRHSVEFAAFLKETFGQIPDISIFA